MQPKTLSELQNYYKQKAKERGFEWGDSTRYIAVDDRRAWRTCPCD